MGYPQGPQGPYGQQGPYQPQQPQQGYGQQQAPPGYQQQPPANYGAQGGYAPAGAGSGYDFGGLYGQADMSSNLIDKGRYPAVIEANEWGRTKDGTKGAWTIVFRITGGQAPSFQGPGAGTKLTMTLSVNPTKADGAPNPQGLGIMYRQLGAMGIPIPPNQPFWELGWSPEQVAQATIGRPVMIQVIQDDSYGDTTRNKVRDIQPPAPNQPTQVPQAGQAPPQQAAPPQAAQQAQQQGYAPQGGQAPPQPWQQPQQNPQAQMGQPGQDAYGNPYPQAGGPQYQGYAPQPGQPATPQQPQGGPPPGYAAGPTAQPQPGTYNPAVPPYGQQAQPGQGGTGQFTQQGQAIQPGTHPGHAEQVQQQGPPPNGYPQQGQPQQGQGQAPALPPWAQPPQ
jgi:hypothetical protein